MINFGIRQSFDRIEQVEERYANLRVPVEVALPYYWDIYEPVRGRLTGIAEKIKSYGTEVLSVHAVQAQRKFKIGDFEFIGMNWVVDYPFRLKDRCRMDTDDYVFQEQFGTGLLSMPNGFQELNNWFAYVKTLPTIKSELKQLPFPKNMAHSVYVIHMPPWRLGLDKCSHGREVGSE